jgi:hypothetical protein
MFALPLNPLEVQMFQTPTASSSKISLSFYFTPHSRSLYSNPSTPSFYVLLLLSSSLSASAPPYLVADIFYYSRLSIQRFLSPLPLRPLPPHFRWYVVAFFLFLALTLERQFTPGRTVSSASRKEKSQEAKMREGAGVRQVRR